MSGSRGYDQILDVELREVLRGDSVVSDDGNGDTEDVYVLVEVVSEGVEVVNHQNLNGSREFWREGFFRFSICFGSDCGYRLGLFRGRVGHGLSKKARAIDGSGS